MKQRKSNIPKEPKNKCYQYLTQNYQQKQYERKYLISKELLKILVHQIFNYYTVLNYFGSILVDFTVLI